MGNGQFECIEAENLGIGLPRANRRAGSGWLESTLSSDEGGRYELGSGTVEGIDYSWFQCTLIRCAGQIISESLLFPESQTGQGVKVKDALAPGAPQPVLSPAGTHQRRA